MTNFPMAFTPLHGYGYIIIKENLERLQVDLNSLLRQQRSAYARRNARSRQSEANKETIAIERNAFAL